MIKKNKHQIWYENSLKLIMRDEIARKQLIKKITQNKRICNHKNKNQIKKIIKWLEIKSKNKIQLQKKLKSK